MKASTKNYIGWGLLLATLVFSLFWNLGGVPFFNEEPRRALIALEMLLNHNLLVPTELGDFYYKKPPVFNWLIIAAFKLTGTQSGLAARSVTIVSLLLWAGLHFWWVQRYLNRQVALYSALLLVVSADIYFAFSQLAEIDIFYSLVTYAGFVSIHHLYQKKQLWWLFFSAYLLCAVGTLTKGAPSPVFTGLSLLAFFIYHKDWKKLFSLPHFSGIALFLLIVAGYFWAYSQYNPLDGYFAGLWSQSGDRTLLNQGFLRLVQHLFVFPLNMLGILLPATLFLLFWKGRTSYKALLQQPLLKVMLLLFIVNFMVYWISPGARQRYIYMLFPLLITPMTWLFFQYRAARPRLERVLRYFFTGLMLLIAAVAIGFTYSGFFNTINTVPQYIIIIFAVCSILVSYVLLRYQNNLALVLIVLFVFGRLLFNGTVLEERSHNGEHVNAKHDAQKIVEIVGDEPLHLYKIDFDGGVSLGMAYYLTRERQQVLDRKNTVNCNDYFITIDRNVQGMNYKLLHEFNWHNMHYYLLRFDGCAE